MNSWGNKKRVFYLFAIFLVTLLVIGGDYFFARAKGGETLLGQAVSLFGRTFFGVRVPVEEIVLNQESEKEVVDAAQQFSECKFDTDKIPLREKIIINEIAWMGVNDNSNHEWLEFKNLSGEAIDLSFWQLVDREGQIRVVFESGAGIGSGGFYLLERGEEATKEKSDILYQGNLKNED